jgi:hypothetical protein
MKIGYFRLGRDKRWPCMFHGIISCKFPENFYFIFRETFLALSNIAETRSAEPVI